ncbi:MAG: hypothetical protein IJX69_01180 [Oscillospiraceae bacterium]|nr:hypothetical protein [Oscillospiraceae bacterium]
MNTKKMRRILEKIAQTKHTTPEQVRREMEHALAEAQASSDPLIQARWERIPHRGKEVTLEEFLEYTGNFLAQS